MHDLILMVVQFLFVLALVPAVFTASEDNVPYFTSTLTTVGLWIMAFVFDDLGLTYSFWTTAALGSLWFLLIIKRFVQGDTHGQF